MYLLLFSLGLLINVTFAEIGTVSKIVGSNDAFIMRGINKIPLAPQMNLEEGDEVYTSNAVVLLHLYPTTQLSLSKQTEIKITQNKIEVVGSKQKLSSIINFIKGLIRLRVTKEANLEIDQKVEADSVAFAVRGTEFEVTNELDDFELNVAEGSVEVSSPFVNTFVPEIVKAKESFRFNRKKHSFRRVKFLMKFKNHPPYLNKLRQPQKRQLKRATRRSKGQK